MFSNQFNVLHPLHFYESLVTRQAFMHTHESAAS